MKRLAFLCLLLSGCASGPATPVAEDPNLWLEEIDSERALAWVRARNEKTTALLSSDARYAAIEGKIREILTAKDRIPMPQLSDGWVYNFWQDAKSVRGVWRRVRPEEYEKAEPAWETVLDVDALAKEESENWVWKSSTPLAGGERCIVKLSRGGKDAAVAREFDLAARRFVPDGFALPEAKSDVAWRDRDTLVVCTDWGPGSLTQAGYPRIAKLWKRGQPLAEARTIFECAVTDSGVDTSTTSRPEGTRTFVVRARTFWDTELHLLDPDGTLRRVPLPDDADVQLVFQDRVLAVLRSGWTTATRAFPAGSLIALPLSAIGTADPAALAEEIVPPRPRRSVAGVAGGRDAIYVSFLDNVIGSVVRYARSGDAAKP